MTKPELLERLKRAETRLDELEYQNKQLIWAATEIQWMSRRYAHKRSTYAPGMHNDATRVLLELDVTLKPDTLEGEGTIWAADGMGHPYDGLNESYFTPGHPAATGEVIPLRPKRRLDDDLVRLLGTDVMEAVKTLEALVEAGHLIPPGREKE